MTRSARQDEVAAVPRSRSISTLRAAARDCRACPLWKLGTQTVFGEGPRRAPVVLIGEQPGDQEDKAGKPFIGPAGRLLDRALLEAGVDRTHVYVTNAVKHFKWEPRGPRRIHKAPNSREIAACRPWLLAEIAALEPGLLVCLGGTAARSIFGRTIRVLQQRGQVIDSPFGMPALVTVHPSSLLRIRDRGEADLAFAELVKDLRQVEKSLGNEL